MAPILAATIPLCIPVLLSLLVDNELSIAGSSEVMSLYLPTANKHCNTLSKDEICFDSVVQQFVRCNGRVWEKVFVNKTVPVIMPKKDDLTSLSDKIKFIEKEMKDLEVKHKLELNSILDAVSDPQCPEGWTLHDFSCYQDQGQTMLGWKEAQGHCEKRSANLPTIKKESQLAVLQNFYPLAPFWIGLSRTTSYQGFQWSDGLTSLDFTSWRTGEPTLGQGEDCVEMLGLTWDNTQCQQIRNFVCQKLCCGL